METNYLVILSLVLWGVIEPVSAAGGVSIFELGKEIDLRPWQIFAMYIMVIIVSVFYELLTHHVDTVVTTNSGRAIVHHIYKEVMILGGISLLLTILENSGGDLMFEPVFFHYVHFVIFFMAINLIVFVIIMFMFIDKSWHFWEYFESVVNEIEGDPSINLSEKTALLSQFVKRYPGGSSMKCCLIFFRAKLPFAYKNSSFTRYMKKKQRREMLSFLEFTPMAWGALSVMVLLVAIQDYCVGMYYNESLGGTLSSSGSSGSEDFESNETSSFGNETTYSNLQFDLSSMGLFISVQGYVPLCAILLCYYKVRQAYAQLIHDIELAISTKKNPHIIQQIDSASTSLLSAEDRENLSNATHSEYLFFGKPKLILNLLQVNLLFLVFYLATVTTNLANRLVGIKGGVLLLFVAIMPCILATVVLIPRVMPKYTILRCIELDLSTVVDIRLSDEAGGRYRRILDREVSILEPPPFFEDIASPLDAPVAKLLSTNAPVVAPPSKRASGGLIVCEECEQQLAIVSCGLCGMLCQYCDADYHRLKKNKGHVCVPVRSSNVKNPLKKQEHEG
eukprot:TRINITY_DN12094_c0_g1_i1.p1 TRINITY_DN12094_c0_g1~~TRINITY_DN12094_c0_g1_i1.p1  ORF type:complete len:563 (+),score=77.03 TRINITY_DN12094_c0_g1_i1:113-1801(+)